MACEAWLPIGFSLPNTAKLRIARFGSSDWQIFDTAGGGRALVARDSLVQRWIASGLITAGTMESFQFGEHRFASISSPPSQELCPISEGRSPANKTEALAFSMALKATRTIDSESGLQDAVYIEKLSRLLPTYGITSKADDDVVLGYWLTGGTNIPATAFRRLCQNMSWLDASHVKDVVEAAGFHIAGVIPSERREAKSEDDVESVERSGNRSATSPKRGQVFELPGRPDLAAFFNEHVIDIVLHRERYRALGIEFPSAVILHGPPGCGKTFAVDRLVDFLGWPSFQIEASSVASPYIHETSKKVAQVFDQAMENSPSVLVIDEMEAFLADREMGSGHHRVEEVAEFLRRIPEAVKNEVLIIAMTNRIEMIDPAIQRRGRFDHVIEVSFPGEAEVRALLENLLSALPIASDVDGASLAKVMAGRPLSDVSFVVREGARLAARHGKTRVDQECLRSALNSTPARAREGEAEKRIGFR